MSKVIEWAEANKAVAVLPTYSELRAQRDELLAVLERYVDADKSVRVSDQLTDDGIAAIARVRGDA